MDAGDVLSPEWTTDAADTDEQPAVTLDDEEFDGSAAAGLQLPSDPPSGPAPVDAPPSVELSPEDRDAAYWNEDGREDGEDAADDGAPQEPRYLPLDQGYDQPRRGFLGSGWTGEPDPESDGEREVRRRTRVLLVAAAAVVVVGASAGWLVSTAGPGDPCGGATRCASVGDAGVLPPSATAKPEPPTAAPTDLPTGSTTVAPSPSVSPTVIRARATRSPSPSPTVRPTSRATAEAEPENRPTERDSQVTDTVSTTKPSSKPSSGERPTTAPTSQPTPTGGSDTSPSTPAPQPQDPPEKRSCGLLGWMFGCR